MPKPPNESQKSAPAKKHASKKSEERLKEGYYYDDAHGYQDYDPDADDEDLIEEEKKPGQV